MIEETRKMVTAQLWRKTDTIWYLSALPSLSCRCCIQFVCIISITNMFGLLVDTFPN